MNFPELFEKGGPAMWPLLILSILSLATILERIWFWAILLTQEQEIVNRVLASARRDWSIAHEMARQASRQPMGRFLYAALRMRKPEPDVFRLALEAAADDELATMRRGDKILEAVIALAPLLGLLGTVLGLIDSLRGINLGDIGTTSAVGVTSGIGNALISTATGLIIAIFSLAFYRVFQAFSFNQVKVFRRAGNELELLYRQYWPYIKADIPFVLEEEPAPEESQQSETRTPETEEIIEDQESKPPLTPESSDESTFEEKPESQE